MTYLHKLLFLVPHDRLTLRVTAITAGLVGSLVAVGVFAQLGNLPAPNAGCTPARVHLIGQAYPVGETDATRLEPEFPIWCYTQPDGLTTRVSAGNSWRDTFDNGGPSVQRFNDLGAAGYRVFNQFISAPSAFKSGTFVNMDHWMVDLVDVTAFRLSGGIMVSPDRQFQFESGKFVVEVDAAAGGDGMGGANRFYEIDISPAAATSFSVDNLYGYGQFGTAGGLGCRLERQDDGGHVVCSMYDTSGRAADGNCLNPAGCPNPQHSGRVWETQGIGNGRTASSVQGGYPQWPIPGTNMRLSDVWRQCGANVHDLHCRDRFRIELTKTSLHLFVNGYPAMLIDGLYAVNPATGADNRIPDSWLSGGVRPYFASWVNGGQHAPIRWHWNAINVQPRDANGLPSLPSASPSFCLGAAVLADGSRNTCPHQHVPGQPEVGAGAAGSTATPIPAATSTPTPVPAATSTPTPTAVPATSTPTPTSTPVPAETCAALVRINGVEQWLSKPLAFCQP